MGVGEDFQAFKDNYNIGTDLIGSISYRYKRITGQLNKDFWSTDSDTAHSRYVGSYGRDTAAKGISDLDMGFQLPYSEYEKYNSYKGNGQSALLQAVRTSVQRTYPSSSVGGDGQVVVVSFTDGITFEILPYFINKDRSWTFPDSNDGGKWRVCNPIPEQEAIDDRNRTTNRNLKHLCRMMRVWVQEKSVPMSGMLIDTLAYQFIENWEHKDKSFLYHDYMARDFFKHLSEVRTDQEYWRAPGSGATVAKKGNFQVKANTAYIKALEAIEHNSDSTPTTRRAKWREIFGGLYPA